MAKSSHESALFCLDVIASLSIKNDYRGEAGA